MKKILRKLKSKFVRHEILEEFTLDNTVYRVIERKNLLKPTKNQRALAFKVKGNSALWFHSKIYVNPKQIFQPYAKWFQDIFDSWGKQFGVENALVLGCAGCAIPRFLAFRFKCKIIGVEYIEKFVEIANKHFLLDEIKNNFTLIQGDGFAFIKDYAFENKQDIIFVDMFDENQFLEDAFSKEFIKNLFDKTSENSLVLFNLLGKNKEEVLRFIESINEQFNRKLVMERGGKVCLLLIKSQNNEETNAFINSLEKI